MRASHWFRVGALRVMLVGLVACAPPDDSRLVPRSTLFVGVDVSGSFEDDGRWDDAMAFASHYIYGHLQGKAELEEPRALFVGAIGGETPGQPQAFHPIHDFEGKTPAEIEADLREWFAPDDAYTDFNAFFRRAASLVQRQNLALAPITLVLLTDGVPDVDHTGAAAAAPERYQALDLDPLEYLARNVTVRVLYPEPAVAVRWERDVPRDRVRMWTVDNVVMQGWREQVREPERLAMATERMHDPRISGPAPAASESVATISTPVDSIPGAELARAAPAGVTTADPQQYVIPQPELWRWIEDNVDFRVGRRVF